MATTTKATTTSRTTTTPVARTAAKVGAKAPATETPAKPAAPQIKPGRFFIGMLVLFVALQALQFGLIWLNSVTKNALNDTKHPLFTLPLIGKVTPLILIFFAAVVLVYWAMIRFNIIPRAALSRTQTTTAGAASGKTTVTPTKGTATGKTTGVKELATKNSVASTRKTASTSEPETVATVKSIRGSQISGDNDDLYQQAKAQQRAMARKRRKH